MYSVKNVLCWDRGRKSRMRLHVLRGERSRIQLRFLFEILKVSRPNLQVRSLHRNLFFHFLNPVDLRFHKVDQALSF